MLLQQKHLATKFRDAVHRGDGRPIINDLNDTRIKRRDFLSGGDPLHPQNVPEILKLVKRIRRECPGKGYLGLDGLQAG
jgi:organic radical activating enzyme